MKITSGGFYTLKAVTEHCVRLHQLGYKTKVVKLDGMYYVNASKKCHGCKRPCKC